jgi:hypothetical protein
VAQIERNVFGIVEKAVGDYRSPGRCARFDDIRNSRSVLECASPLALSRRHISRLKNAERKRLKAFSYKNLQKL